MRLYRQAREAIEAAGNIGGQPVMLGNLGQACRLAGQPRKALVGDPVTKPIRVDALVDALIKSQPRLQS